MEKKTIITAALALVALAAQAQKLTVRDGDKKDVGQVTYRQPVTATFELKNKGLRKLRIDDVRVSCGCLAVDYPKGDIGANDNFTLKLTYDARQMGHFEKTAAIYANGSRKPLYLTLKGVVVEEATDFSGEYPFTFGSLVADKGDLEFDDVNKGDRPVQTIHIRNTGNQTLTPNLMHLPPFLTADVSPTQLRPDHAGKITVTLHSEKLHDLGVTSTSVYLGNQLGDKVSDKNEMGVSAVLLPDFDKLTSTQKAQAPKVALSTETLTIRYEGKSKKKGEVRIANEGQSDLQLSSMHLFGSGLRITLGKQTLKAGESTELKITATAAETRKSRVKPRVLLITNDPAKPKIIINVNAM